MLDQIAGVLADVRDQQITTQDQIAKTGLYYLLKIRTALAE